MYMSVKRLGWVGCMECKQGGGGGGSACSVCVHVYECKQVGGGGVVCACI